MTPEEEIDAIRAYQALREYDPFKFQYVTFEGFLNWYEEARKLKMEEEYVPPNQQVMF